MENYLCFKRFYEGSGSDFTNSSDSLSLVRFVLRSDSVGHFQNPNVQLDNEAVRTKTMEN